MTSGGLDLFVMTRGSSVDYAFIGAGPPESWWMRWGEWTRFEDPTVIVEAGRFFVSGIRSKSRKDRVETPIRYSIAGQLRTPEESERAIKLLEAVIPSLADDDGLGAIAWRLDDIDDTLYESALSKKPEGLAASDEVNRKLLELVDKLPGPGSGDGQPMSGRWHCRLSAEACEHLLTEARRVFGQSGDTGVAAYLNLAGPEDLPRMRLCGPFAVVTRDGPPRPERVPPDWLPTGGPGHPKAGPPTESIRVVLIGGVVVLVLTALIVWATCPRR